MKIVIDDFGIEPTYDDAILDLLKRSPASFASISCIVINPATFSQLFTLKKNVQQPLGLHLTLTDFISSYDPKRKLPTFRQLVFQSFFTPWKLLWIRYEIRAQLHAFEILFNHPPAYIDGHKHVQQLPYIREMVAQECLKYKSKHNFYIRNSFISPITSMKLKLGMNTLLKNLLMSLVGSSFKKFLCRTGYATNSQLLGLYHYGQDTDFGTIFSKYKDSSTSEDIFFCHPGADSEELLKLDGPHLFRRNEHTFFSKQGSL